MGTDNEKRELYIQVTICGTCKLYEALAGMCCNENSEHCKKFKEEFDTCKKWERWV